MENPVDEIPESGESIPKVENFELTGQSASEAAPPVDPEAPYGRSKIDGRPLKKRGRPSKEDAPSQRERLESVTRAPPKPQLPPSTPAPPPIVIDYDALARLAATLWFEVPQPIFGRDWAPADKDEANTIAAAFRRYFISAGITDIPPGIALALSLGSYTIARVNKPTVKERLMGMFEWIRSKTKR